MATVTVSIKNMKFQPPTIEVKAGDSVQWKNEANMAHTATSDSDAWDTGDIEANATSKAVAFPAKGSNPYHCEIHPGMKGTVVVK